MDFSLYRTIAAQGGVFTTAQARERYPEWEIRKLVASGRWRRSRWKGVLVDGELPDSPAVVIRAASLLVGSDLVACHSTAALHFTAYDVSRAWEARVATAARALGVTPLPRQRS